MTTALPHGIDWGKLEFRFQSNKLSAHWGEHCIATVHAGSPQDRPHLIGRLKEEVRRQKHNYARRPAGARASRDIDEMFDDVGVILRSELSGAIDGETIKAWMDLAIADVRPDGRLHRDGGLLMLGDALLWSAHVDDRGRWFAHYSCLVPRDQLYGEPFWSKHTKLYHEAALRQHVLRAVAEFPGTPLARWADEQRRAEDENLAAVQREHDFTDS